ncbi:ATP-dependent DNA helicase PIF1 [Phlyctema vagabunda]|uniref:ATP-dependent DNA helicase n=1 Tax=Phlyctema vagabunda TaxID=108571 RepID=A0ABR4PAL5_9HELO
MGKNSKKVAYVVFRGRKTGIFNSWAACQEQVSGFQNNHHRGYETLQDAQRGWETWLKDLKATEAAGSRREANSLIASPDQKYSLSGQAERQPLSVSSRSSSDEPEVIYDATLARIPAWKPSDDVVVFDPENYPLPEGWEMRYVAAGHPYGVVPYFVNHQSKTTVWEDPRTALFNRQQSNAINLGEGANGLKRSIAQSNDIVEWPTVKRSKSQTDQLEEMIDLKEFKAPLDSTSEPKPVVLTPEQQAVVDMAMQRHNIFLTGAAGSGKTVTLKEILGRLHEKFREEEKHRSVKTKAPKVQVVAPTGIAALPLEGKTTYSFCGWNADSFKHPIWEVLSSWKKSTAAAMEALEVLVVEEVSMVENQFLERMSLLMQRILGNRKPFGGKQVILLGDFHQLPPVKPFDFCFECGEKMVRLDPVCTKRNCMLFGWPFNRGEKWSFKSTVWKDLQMKHVKLDQIHRQKDTSFQDILNKIRNGHLLDNHEWHELERRKEVPQEAFPVRLMSKIAEVKAFNNAKLESIKATAITWNANDSSRKIGIDENALWASYEVKSKLREYKDSLKDHRFPTDLTLKVGAKVVLLSNLDPSKGLVNGSQGTIVGFVDTSAWSKQELVGSSQDQRRLKLLEAFEEGNSPMRPIVRFRNGKSIVQKTILPEPSESLRGNSNDRYAVCRTQIPLTLAWALSIHKSQGMTLEHVEVSSRDIFETGQLYVGLSRATKLEGLTVSGYSRQQLGIDKDVLEFYQNTKWENLTGKAVAETPTKSPFFAKQTNTNPTLGGSTPKNPIDGNAKSLSPQSLETLSLAEDTAAMKRPVE